MNGYPIKKLHKVNKKTHLTLLNIGQILLICFLFIVIIIQSSGLISGLAGLTKNLTEDFGFSSNKSSGNSNNLNDSNYNSGKNSAQSIYEKNNSNGENINNNAINIDNNDNINNNSEILFILGENNGRLAVLSPDGQTVYETYDVYINTLPDYDKNLLLNGIKIKTAEELRSLLEDYSS